MPFYSPTQTADRGWLVSAGVCEWLWLWVWVCVWGSILLCVPLTLCSLFIFIAHVAWLCPSDYGKGRLQREPLPAPSSHPLAAAILLAIASCRQMDGLHVHCPPCSCCCSSCCRRALVSSGKNFAITVIWWDLQGLHPTHTQIQAQLHTHPTPVGSGVLPVWTFICWRTFTASAMPGGRKATGRGHKQVISDVKLKESSKDKLIYCSLKLRK